MLIVINYYDDDDDYDDNDHDHDNDYDDGHDAVWVWFTAMRGIFLSCAHMRLCMYIYIHIIINKYIYNHM